MTAVTAKEILDDDPLDAPVKSSRQKRREERRAKSRRTETSPKVTAIRYLLLIFSLAIVLIPVYLLIVTSFKGAAEADPSRTWFFPEVWETQNWERAWDALAEPIGRTFLLVIPSSIISTILGSMNGFVRTPRPVRTPLLG